MPMTRMPWVFDDGGRKAAGFKGVTRDCVARAIAIATELPYPEVYAKLNVLAENHERPRSSGRRSNARSGVRPALYRRYLASLGWTWHPTMKIGSGTQVHLCAEELPAGRLIVQVSRHLTAVIDGEIRDLFDPQREAGRCVYGYFSKQPPTQE